MKRKFRFMDPEAEEGEEEENSEAELRVPESPTRASGTNRKKAPPKKANAQEPIPLVDVSSQEVLEFNAEQNLALTKALAGENLFITGGAGTGKTAVTKAIIHQLRKVGLKVAVTGTTGVASYNIGGCTIHNLIGLNDVPSTREGIIGYLSLKRPTSWKTICELQTLIIDEVSMLSPEMFELIDFIFRGIRKREAFFGGVQVIMVGDFLQLPPIGKGGMCFQSDLWGTHITGANSIVLEESFRQADAEFLDLLSAFRFARFEQRHKDLIRKMISTEDEARHKICCRNDEVALVNNTAYATLKGASCVYLAIDNAPTAHGSANQIDLNELGAHKTLELKEGCKVMLTTNLRVSDGLVNGALGTVVGFTPGSRLPRVKFERGEEVIDRHEFRYKVGDSVLASRVQLPLKLAYAMTVHKSQGLTLSSVELFLKNAFCEGQAYTAVSRVREIKDITFKSIVLRNVTCSQAAVTFYKLLPREVAQCRSEGIEAPIAESRRITPRLTALATPTANSQVEDEYDELLREEFDFDSEDELVIHEFTQEANKRSP